MHFSVRANRFRCSQNSLEMVQSFVGVNLCRVTRFNFKKQCFFSHFRCAESEIESVELAFTEHTLYEMTERER